MFEMILGPVRSSTVALFTVRASSSSAVAIRRGSYSTVNGTALNRRVGLLRGSARDNRRELIASRVAKVARPTRDPIDPLCVRE